MPRDALTRRRELSDLLQPSTEIAKFAVRVPKDAVQSAVVVGKLVLIGDIEHRELLIELKTWQPLGGFRVAAMMLRRKLVSISAPSGWLPVDYDCW